MLWNLDPNISTLYKGYDFKENYNESFPITEMSKVMIWVLKGEGESPMETVPLDEESKKYIRIKLI